MRFIIVGDIHGCLAELDALLDRVGPVLGDVLLFVGDLVDRGPDTVGVMDDVMPTDPHWTSAYVGNEGHVFFGHDPQLDPPEPIRTQHATGLDTGCCFGGRLTAAIIRDGGAPADAEFTWVNAREEYAPRRKLHVE